MENNTSQTNNGGIPPAPGFGGNPMMGAVQPNLPNATGILVLGIISIALCWCGIGIIGLACGIIALVLSGKANRLYNENPSVYSMSSFKNMKAGRVCAIIGLGLSALTFLYYIILFIIYGTALSAVASGMPWDQF